MAYVLDANPPNDKSDCPNCGAATWLLIDRQDTTKPSFIICEDDFSICGYIEQIGVGPVPTE